MANPYHSLLLNDLHHYFPDLLYQPDRFQTVQDVLGYIVQIAQMNPYEQGRQIYRSQRLPVSSSSSLENESNQSYEFHNSSSAYSAIPRETVSVEPSSGSGSASASASASASSSSNTPSLSGSSPSSNVPSLSGSSPSSNEAEQLLRALFQRRTHINPISRPPANRFRISMPLDLSNYYSVYSSQSPDILQTLSQLSSDLLRPVIVRPTEEHLSRNTYVYCSEVSHNENCSICQDPMEAGQETRTILACSHCFHRECIDRWFQENVRCPTCRHDVRESS
jgi:hypothetical protein